MRIVETNEALAAFLDELSDRALSGAGYRIPARPDLLPQALPDPGGGARRRKAIIDPLAHGLDLAPFYELLKRPDIVKVLHAARQDIEIFYLQGGVLPDPLFDTQVAAMVCGFGDAASYETLARKLAHVGDRQIGPLHRLEPPPAFQAATGICAGRCHPSAGDL